MISAVSSGFRPTLPNPAARSVPSAPVAAAAVFSSDPPAQAPGGNPTAAAPVNTLPDPNNPLAALLSTPVTMALVMADLGQALLHPIQTVKSLWSLGKDLHGFDAMTPLSAASGPQARDTLHAAVADYQATGLTHVLGFLAKSIDRRAGVAFNQLRPAVETQLSTTSGQSVTMTWPSAGHNWTDLDDTVAIQETLSRYPASVVQKAFNGIKQIQVQDGSLLGQPVQRQAATLVISRPLLPGQNSVAGSLMAYLNQEGSVSANF